MRTILSRKWEIDNLAKDADVKRQDLAVDNFLRRRAADDCWVHTAVETCKKLGIVVCESDVAGDLSDAINQTTGNAIWLLKKLTIKYAACEINEGVGEVVLGYTPGHWTPGSVNGTNFRVSLQKPRGLTSCSETDVLSSLSIKGVYHGPLCDKTYTNLISKGVQVFHYITDPETVFTAYTGRNRSFLVCAGYSNISPGTIGDYVPFPHSFKNVCDTRHYGKHYKNNS